MTLNKTQAKMMWKRFLCTNVLPLCCCQCVEVKEDDSCSLRFVQICVPISLCHGKFAHFPSTSGNCFIACMPNICSIYLVHIPLLEMLVLLGLCYLYLLKCASHLGADKQICPNLCSAVFITRLHINTKL